MPGFELYIDANPLKRSAQEASRALVDLGTTAERSATTLTTATERAVATTSASLTTISATATRTGQSFAAAGDQMSRALGAAGAGSSLASSIGSISSALQSTNLQVGALAASQGLQSLSRLGSELGSMTVRGGRVASALTGVLSVVSKASPWLALGSAAASVGAAFLGTSSASDAAAKSIQRQADAIDSLLSKTRQLDYARGLGLGDPRGTVQGIGSTLTTLLSSDRLKFGAEEAAGLYGLSEVELRQLLARDGYDSALDQQTTRFGTRYTESLFTRDQIRFAGERLLRERRAADVVSARSARPSPYAGDAEFGTGSLLTTSSYTPAFSRGEYLRTTETDAMHAMQSGQALQAAREEADRAEAERLQRNIEMADQLGDAIGGALSSGILGAQSMGRAFASLFAGFADQGIRAATRGLTSAVFGGFGATSAQGGGTARTNPD